MFNTTLYVLQMFGSEEAEIPIHMALWRSPAPDPRLVCYYSSFTALLLLLDVFDTTAASAVFAHMLLLLPSSLCIMTLTYASSV
jgi:hypothetical protein